MISVHGHGKAFTIQYRYSLLANIKKVIDLFRSTSRLDVDLGPWILNCLSFIQMFSTTVMAHEYQMYNFKIYNILFYFINRV